MWCWHKRSLNQSTRLQIMSLQLIAKRFRHLPLHPQWLLGRKAVPDGLENITGLVLDIGAADRWIQSHLSNKAQYIALDYPPTGMHLYDASPDVFGNITKLPFRDNQFNVVICLEVLEHVNDPWRGFAEISRVLKKEGEAWISMPFLYPMHDKPFDFQRFTQYGLINAAEKANLRITQLKKSKRAVVSAGLLLSLAIGGGAVSAKGWRKYALMPFAILLITVVNCFTWLLAKTWPDWNDISTGFLMRVKKI